MHTSFVESEIRFREVTPLGTQRDALITEEQ
jgi:hypothetical protein